MSRRDAGGALPILDDFAAVTGYHRKHAIRLLAGGGDREEDAQVGDAAASKTS